MEVLFDIDPALPRHLLGDAMRLQQVLTNLCGNAIKFTAQGEVVLSIHVLARDETGVGLEISVRDTGIGIAPENHARIFSGFTQAEASTTRRFGGTGLGLAISQRLVSLMGGELQLDSALGQGSRFHFRIQLPLATEAVQAPESDTAAPRATVTAQLRALVVDDNATARELLQRMGDSLGWTIDVAASGEEALALLQRHADQGIGCDAIFVDWQMPGLDGWATSQRIRALGLGGATPVIVMVTAHGREMLAQRSEAEQAMLDGFLVKPVTPSMLYDALADAGLAPGARRPALSAPVPAAKRLHGLRLLVAEDNANNQQVARELLEDEGALVHLVDNGQQAVEAVAAADPPFDVVLMDLQMPVMDGFTATRAIRHHLAMPALPIVAMTANVLASDRQACLDAGMNEHVGKPFDLDHLVRVLQSLAGIAGSDAAATVWTADAAAPALEGALREAAAAAGVQIAQALSRLGGKREVYGRMLQRFVEDLAGWPTELQALAASGNGSEAARLLHTVKGVAATLGVEGLAAETAAAEQLLLQIGEVPALQHAADRACASFAAATPGLRALSRCLRSATPAALAAAAAAPTVTDDQDLRRALQRVAMLLRNSDLEAVDALTPLQGHLWGALQEQFAALDDAIAGLEFDPALRHCEELLEALST